MKIIEAAVTGMAEAGRGDEAKALLQSDDVAGGLDEDTSIRLSHTIERAAQAHETDRVARERREAADETNATASAALAFTTGFRPRMATGEATQAEIASAETEGTLTTAQADRLCLEMADQQARREDAMARSGRINGVLDAGTRLDAENEGDQDDVAHHYEATLKPALTDLDPANKAAAIGGYVANTGIAPKPALDTLLGLAVIGRPMDRIAAARTLDDIFNVDPDIGNISNIVLSK